MLSPHSRRIFAENKEPLNAFRDIEALLRVISREKEIIRFLFTSRKAPSLHCEEAMENFFAQDERRLNLLLDHGVIRLADGVLVLEDTYLRFFEEVLEVNEEINVLSVKQHIGALTENIELWLTTGTESRRSRYIGEVIRILRSIALATRRNVIDLKRAIDGTYKNERDYAVKRKRLEQLDAKRADIALLVKESEKVIGERHPGFFGTAMDAHLKETVAAVKDSLTESYHNLLELDRQIILYLHRIEAEHKLSEKIRRIKYVKDQLVWEQATDVLFLLQTHRPVFLEKRPRYNCLPSLDALTGTADGIAALKEAHVALHHPVREKKRVQEPLTLADLCPAPAIRDGLSPFEVRSAFLGSGTDLMRFIDSYRFSEPLSEEARLTLFCRIAAEFADELRISGQYRETARYAYPIIYPRSL